MNPQLNERTDPRPRTGTAKSVARIILECPFVGILRHYSKKSSLGVDLQITAEQLRKTQLKPHGKRRSVSSSGRVGKTWKLEDKLSEEDLRGIAEGFRAGVPKIQLARQFGISDSSVKRILRQQRAAGWIITEAE